MQSYASTVAGGQAVASSRSAWPALLATIGRSQPETAICAAGVGRHFWEQSRGNRINPR